jgi:hypothetical protein
MDATERLLDDLARAVLDGMPVDWAAAAAATDDADTQAIVRHLEVLAGVVQLHRDTTAETPTSKARLSADGTDRWGHLQLLERIGAGAFGEVFRAWDPRLEREVALKLLPASPASRPDGNDDIIREGRLLAKVRHPNVLVIHGAEQIGDRIGLSMEFVRGRTLEEVLSDGGVFAEREYAEPTGGDFCRTRR